MKREILSLLRKRGRVIPFGYREAEDREGFLEPVPDELKALEYAKTYLQSSSSRDVAQWLTSVTGRYISHVGLLKIMRERAIKEKNNEQDSTSRDNDYDSGYSVAQ